MSSSKPSSRYASIQPFSSSSALKSTSKKLPSPADNSSRVLAKNNPPTFGTIVKKFMEKRSNSKPDAIAKDSKKTAGKGSGAPTFLKLFNRSGLADRTPTKALREANNNTRTLGMVLRSERELLSQNREYEKVIAELRLLVEEKNLEMDELRDRCLKQREEINSLKNAILFPDVESSQFHELNEAREIMPRLQQQVSFLRGKLQCLAVDLAELKADKSAAKSCFDGLVSSPTTPKYDKEFLDALEYNSGDSLRIDDINPCLTPCFSKVKSKCYGEVGYSSPSRNRHSEDSSDLSSTVLTDSNGGHYQKQSIGIKSSRKICISDESKWRFGKQRPHNLF